MKSRCFWTRCSCGYIAQDHNKDNQDGSYGCDWNSCQRYDGKKVHRGPIKNTPDDSKNGSYCYECGDVV